MPLVIELCTNETFEFPPPLSKEKGKSPLDVLPRWVRCKRGSDWSDGLVVTYPQSAKDSSLAGPLVLITLNTHNVGLQTVPAADMYKSVKCDGFSLAVALNPGIMAERTMTKLENMRSKLA